MKLIQFKTRGCRAGMGWFSPLITIDRFTSFNCTAGEFVSACLFQLDSIAAKCILTYKIDNEVETVVHVLPIDHHCTSPHRPHEVENNWRKQCNEWQPALLNVPPLHVCTWSAGVSLAYSSAWSRLPWTEWFFQKNSYFLWLFDLGCESLIFILTHLKFMLKWRMGWVADLKLQSGSYAMKFRFICVKKKLQSGDFVLICTNYEQNVRNFWKCSQCTPTGWQNVQSMTCRLNIKSVRNQIAWPAW